MSGTETCVFCRVIAGDAPAQIVAQSDDAVAFHPLDPVTDGHLLVVPREHVIHFMHKPEVTGRVAEYASWLSSHWMDGGDTNLITSAGGFATQTVHHLHFHIVPRSRDDGLALPWTSARATADAAGTIAPCPECESDAAPQCTGCGAVREDVTVRAALGDPDGGA